MGKTAKNAKTRTPRPSRQWLLYGAAAGATVVAGGALLIANGQSGDRQDEPSGASDPGVAQQGAGSSPFVAPSTGATKSPAPHVAMPPLRAVTKLPQTAAERLAAAKQAGADDIKPKRPLIRPESKGADVRVVEKGSVQKGGKVLRTVSAHADLTGYGELAWVADNGVPVGEARCSQTFRLSNEETGKERPTLMICWRTSDERSVYTVSVNVNGRPSKKESAAAIDKAWKALG
ncbi:MAG: hypothetical protein SYR96_35965 [Actinomycetota bacterium]|nr:hypothetical protein [Actinomycetota bacterium]